MRILLSIVLLAGLVFFSSCSHPSSPSGNGGNGNGNQNGTDTASYGTSTMLIDGSTMVQCNNNFFLYDTTGHSLSLQFVRDSAFYVLLSFDLPQLVPGTYNFPPDSGGMWIRGPQALLETIIPYYGNTIQLT